MSCEQLNEEQNKIWEYFQNDGVQSFSLSRPRMEYIVKLVAGKTKVLNIGIGGGFFEALALEKGIDVYVLDPIEKSVKAVCKELGLGEKARVGYSQSIPFNDDMFDAVVMSEVLEHLKDSDLNKTIEEVVRVLKKHGSFIATVPYEENLLSNQAVCPHCGTMFHRWGHKQSFSITTLRSLLGEKGLKVEKIEPRCFPDWSRKGVGNKIKSCIRNILGRFGAGIAQPSILVVAKK